MVNIKDGTFEKRNDLLVEVRGIQIFSTSVIFSAAAVASSLVFIFVPNLETLSLFFFLVGYKYGIKTGLTTVVTSVIIYEMFASQFYGTGGPLPFLLKFPPFLLIMVTGVYFHTVKTGKADFMKDTNQLSSKIGKSNYRTDLLYQIDEHPEINREIHEIWEKLQVGILHKDKLVVTENANATKIISNLLLLYILEPKFIDNRFLQSHKKLIGTDYMNHFKEKIGEDIEIPNIYWKDLTIIKELEIV